MNEQPPQFDPDHLPEFEPPVLDYRSPQPRGNAPGSRKGSILSGMATAWGTSILSIAIAFGTKGDGAAPVAILLIVGCIIYAIVEAVQKKHAGFFIGLILGFLTLFGVGALTIAVVCGAFR